ncbi:hypothetical protein HNR22_001800 [Micromonospora jinlongensis]|uniref:Uncharacterized protein n=1 Tax=Micromonospora jinlongensis TaxID=1287877 RepID=A0A7Z0BCB2_9ACTN|nr:hypothetical protein [Micromonospora jinlongensis]NYH42073.1 hypothetical protein [Micromonospora jinlongensis]
MLIRPKPERLGIRLVNILNKMSILKNEPQSSRVRRTFWVVTTLLLLAMIGILVPVLRSGDGSQTMSAGEELRTDQAPYGWQTSKDVGTRFTDGLNLITVTPQARGPLRLISATPIMDDEGRAVRVIGVRARVNPDMLPPGSDVGSFQEAPGFPPALPYTVGAVPVEGLIVEAPQQGEDRWIEIQIGYEVVAPGRSARRGVELIYEYEGARHKALIPSYVAVCAPSTATCEPEHDR